MNKFESIIQLIISVLQCFIPRVWRKKKPKPKPEVKPKPKSSPKPPPPLEVSGSEPAPLPCDLGSLSQPNGSGTLPNRGDTLTRSLGICLMATGGLAGLYRLLVQ